MFRCTNPSHHHLVWPIHYMLYNNDIDKKHKNTNKSVSIPISVRACRSVWGGVGWSAFVWRLSCSCCSLGWSRRDARSSPTPGRGSPRLSPGWTLPQQLCGENYINICFVINNPTNIWHSLFSFTPHTKIKPVSPIYSNGCYWDMIWVHLLWAWPKWQGKGLFVAHQLHAGLR